MLDQITEAIIAVARIEESRCDKLEHEWWIKSIVCDLPDWPNAYVVELGAWAGAGTTTLGLAARERGWKIASVDLWETGELDDFSGPDGSDLLIRYLRQIRRAGLRPHSLQIIGDSSEAGYAWAHDIAFLHIDACHEWPKPIEDWKAWKPHIIPGGIVAFHDAVESDIPRCLEEMQSSGLMKGFEEIGGLPPLEYREDKGPFWTIGWRTRAFRRIG